MMTAVAEAPVTRIAPQAPPASSAGTRYFAIRDASWELYEILVRDVDGQNVRVTYDEGRLVLMSPLQIHEVIKKLAGAMIEQAAIELDVPCRRFGSTTWKRKD